MRTILPALFLSAALTQAACAMTGPAPQAQQMPQSASAPQDPVRAKGTIWKGEVDGLIAHIAGLTAQPGSAAPYAQDPLAAARILCALGRCHRFYLSVDNPRIRATLVRLIAARNDDGSFGKDPAATTPWCVDALQIMDEDRYRDEIQTARAWQKQRKIGQDAGWEQAVATVRRQLRKDLFPQDVGKAAAEAVRADLAGMDLAAATQTLVHLVACQQANRELDSAPSGQTATFSAAQEQAYQFLFLQLQDGKVLVGDGDQRTADPAITAFVLLALQTKPRALRSQQDSVAIEAGLRWLLDGQHEDGSFGQQVQNYTTSVAIGALVRWGDAAAKDAVAKAQRYILACQNAEQGGYARSDRDYGSIGYGGSQRGDLSNVHFALQALRESGLPADHEAFQKALVFLQRSQNLKTYNDFTGKVTDPDQGGKLMDIAPGNDGGAGYYPGNSAAGYDETPDGKSHPRSYGSMTYALLKSYTLCGLDQDDLRVGSAVQWIRENWTLERNPGFVAPPDDKAHFAGLFYYYMTLAQALDLAGVQTVTAIGPDGAAQDHAWRPLLAARLRSLQQADGSFKNDRNARWMEGLNVLCTCYAMLALERCQ